MSNFGAVPRKDFTCLDAVSFWARSALVHLRALRPEGREIIQHGGISNVQAVSRLVVCIAAQRRSEQALSPSAEAQTQTERYCFDWTTNSGASAKDAQDDLRTALPAIGKARAAPAPKQALYVTRN
jgi:hypothetical protein